MQTCAIQTNWRSGNVSLLPLLHVPSSKRSVSGWARHLDRAADSGLRLPAVWQQFLDAAVQVRWQSCQHVPQIGPRVMAKQPG